MYVTTAQLTAWLPADGSVPVPTGADATYRGGLLVTLKAGEIPARFHDLQIT